jgi:sugar phosphate isomerase/epimerase
VITAPYDADPTRLADRLGKLAEMAAARGLGVVLEFFPWTVVPDLAICRQVVEAAGAGIGILVDSLHFDRSGSRLDELRALPSDRLPFVHLCDATVGPGYTTEELLHAARDERLPPGEGQIDLAAFLGALPPGIPIAVEVPMSGLAAAEGPEAVLWRVHESVVRLLKECCEARSNPSHLGK